MNYGKYLDAETTIENASPSTGADLLWAASMALKNAPEGEMYDVEVKITERDN